MTLSYFLNKGVLIFILHWAGQANYTAGPDDS